MCYNFLFHGRVHLVRRVRENPLIVVVEVVPPAADVFVCFSRIYDLLLGATPSGSDGPLRATGRPGSLRASLGSSGGKSTGATASSSRRSRAFFRVRVVRVVTSLRGSTSAALTPNCRFRGLFVQNFGTARAASASRNAGRCSFSSSCHRRRRLFVGIRRVVDDDTFWNLSTLCLCRRRRAATTSRRSRRGGSGSSSSTSLLRRRFRTREILVVFGIWHFLVVVGKF